MDAFEIETCLVSLLTFRDALDFDTWKRIRHDFVSEREALIAVVERV